MSSLLDILSITTRSDMRSDALKDLERHLTQLNEFQSRPGVDAARLRTIIANLGRLRSDLQGTRGATFCNPSATRNSLTPIKLRSAIPGGTCQFDLPEYFCWLNQPAEERLRAFGDSFRLLAPAVRCVPAAAADAQAGRTRQEIAKGGVFMIAFRP